MSKAREYGIRKLNDFEHARQKTEMYLGSRSNHTQEVILYEDGEPILKEISWVPAIYTAFREVLDNSLDEFVHGYGNRLDITYKSGTMEFSVQDNGRGIPIEYDNEHKNYIATMVISETKTGRNFGERAEVAGTNGLGVSIVNFCSEWLKLEIWKDNQSFVQRFSEGDTKLKFRKPIIKDIKANKEGTKITFKLSSTVFSDMTLPEEFVYSRIYEIAMCNPLLRIYFNEVKIKVRSTPEKTIFGKEKPIVIDIKEPGFKSKFLLKPNFQVSGEYTHTIVNNIPAFNGGVHMEAFRRFFYSGLLGALERESKRRKLKPNRSDVNDGLMIFNITNMKAPNFDSQSKTRLINEEIFKILKNHLENEKLFKIIISKNKDWIEEIYHRCEARTQKKDASEVAKMSKKMLRGKVPDLRDATGKDRTQCILFLGEGKCLEETTPVMVSNVVDGSFTEKMIKDVEIGDMVLTHKNNIKPVINKTSNVKKGFKFSSKYGDFVSSGDHKIFVYDTVTEVFDFILAKDIQSSRHKLVRTKILEGNAMAEIIEIKPSKRKYDLTVVTNVVGQGVLETDMTRDHLVMVYDKIHFTFKKVRADQLNINFHSLLVKTI